MKVLLMSKDRDWDLEAGLPPNAAALTQDLELEWLFRAMAAGDELLLKVAKTAVLASLQDPQAIRYRQHILADCLERPAVVRELYALAVEAIEREKRVWGVLFSRYPEGMLRRSVEVLELLAGLLGRLRRIAAEQRGNVRSEGFTRLFDMLAKELDDDYLALVEDHLRRLAFPDGVRMSARLGAGNKGSQYVLRRPRQTKQSWMGRLQNRVRQLLLRDRSMYVYHIADRDESGFRALSELRGRGIGPVAGALAQATDQVLSFFSLLRLELGFYVGCLNLRDRLAGKGERICFPEPLVPGKPLLSCRGLYDVCLSLSVERRVVGNEVSADGKSLVMVTGANRGGKSTFLRSLGLAQLMMQCGLFAPAERFRADVCFRIFTHFKREEDPGMRRGKLDEELSRMKSIVDELTPDCLVLLNESFASTNEREGSEIARQIVRALVESGVKVCYVTHLFDLAQGLYLAKMDGALFLRAERLADGRRTFRLVEGAPLPTSYGEDVYRRIFGAVSETPTAAARA